MAFMVPGTGEGVSCQSQSIRDSDCDVHEVLTFTLEDVSCKVNTDTCMFSVSKVDATHVQEILVRLGCIHLMKNILIWVRMRCHNSKGQEGLWFTFIPMREIYGG
jgi:hypothetical protein